MSIASFTAIAAAAAAVHIVLWPQPWPGAPSTSGILGGNAALLGQHGQGVELAQEADDRLSRAVGRDEAGRHAGQAALDLEPGLLERVGQELGRFELLQAELGVGPDRVRDPAEPLDGLGLAETVEDELLFLGDLGLGRGLGVGERGQGAG